MLKESECNKHNYLIKLDEIQNNHLKHLSDEIGQFKRTYQILIENLPQEIMTINEKLNLLKNQKTQLFLQNKVLSDSISPTQSNNQSQSEKYQTKIEELSIMMIKLTDAIKNFATRKGKSATSKSTDRASEKQTSRTNKSESRHKQNLNSQNNINHTTKTNQAQIQTLTQRPHP